MKIILFGNNKAAINVFEILFKTGEDIFVVVPYKKIHKWHSSLYEHAINNGILNVFSPENVNSPLFIQKISEIKPDMIISVYYDQILSKEIFKIPTIGAFNIHPSILPKYRGTAPLIWAIINGEKETGITIHRIVEKVDAGEIVMQKKIIIDEDDTGYSLHQKAAEVIKSVFLEFYEKLKKNKIQYVEQKGDTGYFSSKIPPKNKLNWNESTENIYNIIRALSPPLPGAFSFLNRNKIIFSKVQKVNNFIHPYLPEPGSIAISDNMIYVKTGNGYLLLNEVIFNGIEYTTYELIEKNFLKIGDVFNDET